MRLVDKENIRDILTQDWFLDIMLCQNGKKELAEQISNMIYSVPVAYDVEKVVERLEIDKEYYDLFDDVAVEALDDAIRIIKTGGKE